MAAGFEFTGEYRQNISQDEATREALYVLDNVTSAGCSELSPEAFIWGMQGRGVSGRDANATLQHLGSVGVVSFNEFNGIQYPPVPQFSDETTRGKALSANNHKGNSNTLWWIVDGPNNQ